MIYLRKLHRSKKENKIASGSLSSEQRKYHRIPHEIHLFPDVMDFWAACVDNVSIYGEFIDDEAISGRNSSMMNRILNEIHQK